MKHQLPCVAPVDTPGPGPSRANSRNQRGLQFGARAEREYRRHTAAHGRQTDTDGSVGAENRNVSSTQERTELPCFEQCGVCLGHGVCAGPGWCGFWWVLGLREMVGNTGRVCVQRYLMKWVLVFCDHILSFVILQRTGAHRPR